MSENVAIVTALPESALDLTPALIEKAKNEKVVEELKQLKKTAAKTDVEIEKLHAELYQLTRPFRSPQFYFSLISALAALAAVAGILIQHNWRELQYTMKDKELKANQEELKTKQKELDDKQKEFNDKQAEFKKDFNEVDKKFKNEKEARLREAKTLARYSALAKAFVDSIKPKQSPSTIRSNFDSHSDSEGIALVDSERDLLISSLTKETEDFHFMVDLLQSDKADVQTFAALVLSRMPKKAIEVPKQRRELAGKLIDRLLQPGKDSDNVGRQRLIIKAIGNIGADAVPMLAAKLDGADGVDRLNLINAIGEAGPDDPVGAIKSLQNYLYSSNKTVQRQLVGALGSIGPLAKDSEKSLIKLLPVPRETLLDESEDYLLCKEVLTSLGKIGVRKKESVSTLVSFLDVAGAASGDTRTYGRRRELLMALLAALSKIDTDAKEVSPKIYDFVKREKQKAALEQAAIAIGLAGGTEELQKLLHPQGTASDKTRLISAGLIGLSALKSDEERRKTLQDWLREKDDKQHEKYVSSQITKSLRVRGKEAAPFLIDLAASFSLLPNSYIREEIIYLLRDFGGDSAKNVVIAALDDDNPYVKIAAIRTLETLAKGLPETRARIVKLYHETPEKNKEVRTAIREILFTSGVELWKPVVVDALTDKDGKLANDKYYKSYPYVFEKDYVYKIDLASKAFDTFLYVKKGETMLAFDDDGGGDLNSRIYFEPDQAGEYQVWVTSFPPRAIGEFKLEIRRLARKGAAAD